MRRALLVLTAVAALAAGCGGDDEDDGGGGADTGTVSSAKPLGAGIKDLDEAVKASGCKLERHPIEGDNHTTADVKYKTNPPTSGDHDPQWAQDGIYDEAPDLEQSVHALEHGRIDIQYKPGIDETLITQLTALAKEEVKGTAGYHTLLFPNQTNMPDEVAATAWGRSLTCPKASEPAVFDAVRLFRRQYVDKGPEFIP